MPEMVEGTPRDVLTEICGHCGIALYPLEVAAEISGSFVDYEERHTGQGSYVLCGECRLRVKTALAGDLETAVTRRQNLTFEDDHR